MRELGALSSDAERAAAVRRLADAYGEGRLTLDELTRRNELALGARTRGDIARTLDQLPGPRAAGLSPKAHAVGYAAGSGALWLVWLVTRAENPAPTDLGAGYYWPVWVMLVWGIALTLHALHAGGRLPRLGRSPGELPPG